MNTTTLATITGQQLKYFTCQDCGGRFKTSITSMATKPKYCSHCTKSKLKN